MTARDNLYTQLRQVLGEPEAHTLMELLPMSRDIATKTDIDQLTAVMNTRMDGFDTRMDGLDARMDALDARMDGLDARMDRIDDRMDRMERHMERFDDRLHGFHVELRRQTRTFVLASSTSAAVLGGLAFAAASLI